MLERARKWWEGVPPIEKYEICYLVIGSKKSYRHVNSDDIVRMYVWFKNI